MRTNRRKWLIEMGVAIYSEDDGKRVGRNDMAKYDNDKNDGDDNNDNQANDSS